MIFIKLRDAARIEGPARGAEANTGEAVARQ